MEQKKAKFLRCQGQVQLSIHGRMYSCDEFFTSAKRTALNSFFFFDFLNLAKTMLFPCSESCIFYNPTINTFA
jgi:hypothetical protein